MATLTDEQFDDLANGKKVTLPNGAFLRAKQIPDENTLINDYEDCYGRIEPVVYSKYTGYSKPRPNGFDGSAEIIRSHHNDPYWWQPPKDIIRDRKAMDITRNVLREILDFGMHCWVLEMCNGSDAYGNPIVHDYQSICGLEPLMSHEDTVLILKDLAHELLYTYDLDSPLLLK